jgi:2-keto-4-pentenoate hydratase/2-oxohepta-3-ene-1,7-dioic acid hydratase in catechol pathway
LPDGSLDRHVGREIGDPQNVRLATRINGVVKQDSNTRSMIFKLPRIIHGFSVGVSLEPGDVIITGTPSGVGFARKPPELLAVGDTMEMESVRHGHEPLLQLQCLENARRGGY